MEIGDSLYIALRLFQHIRKYSFFASMFMTAMHVLKPFYFQFIEPHDFPSIFLVPPPGFVLGGMNNKCPPFCHYLAKHWEIIYFGNDKISSKSFVEITWHLSTSPLCTGTYWKSGCVLL
jgi:hypothetical protein